MHRKSHSSFLMMILSLVLLKTEKTQNTDASKISGKDNDIVRLLKALLLLVDTLFSKSARKKLKLDLGL